MRVYVTKPVNGLFDVRVDDRRGATKKQWRFKGVRKAELPEVLAEPLATWKTVRDAIRDARRLGKA